MAAPGQQPIIIKRVKKVAGGHHGGAWKVAYADFVTAMMAFFLLLWLLNVTTDVQRKGIADYFAPSSVSTSQSGAGGIFGGKTISAPEAKVSDSSPPGVAETEPQPPGNADEAKDIAEGHVGTETENNTNRFTAKDASALDKQREAEEQQNFKKAEADLRQAISADKELSVLSKNLVIDQTDEGLRIQIVDQNNLSMFPSGSAQMYPATRHLIELVGRAVSRLPNRLAISGHTDAAPFSANSARDNWDLSAERANASRRVLVSSGVAVDRVQNVVGRADRDPYVKGKPEDSQNRRISIVLLRQSLFAKEYATAEPAPAAKP